MAGFNIFLVGLAKTGFGKNRQAIIHFIYNPLARIGMSAQCTHSAGDQGHAAVFRHTTLSLFWMVLLPWTIVPTTSFCTISTISTSIGLFTDLIMTSLWFLISLS